MLITFLFFLVLAAVAGIQGFQRESAGGPILIAMGTHHKTMISAEFLLLSLTGVLVVGGLFLAIGKLACCLVPGESGARLLAFLSAFLLLAALATGFAAAGINYGMMTSAPFVAELKERNAELTEALATFGFLAGLAIAAAETICFLLFLRGVGMFFGNKPLPRAVLRYFTFTILAPLVPAALVGIVYLIRNVRPSDTGLQHSDLVMIVNGCVALVPLALFAYVITLGVWFIMLVRSGRDVILRARLGRTV
jgi:hypothetical protein